MSANRKSHLAWRGLMGLFLLAVSIATVPVGLTAEIKVGQGVCEISLRGEIVDSDAIKLKKLLEKAKAGPDERISLCLDSPGGSFPEAIKIIDLLQVETGATLNGVTTRVQKNSICASACALVFLAGSYNEAPGELITLPSRLLDVGSRGLLFHQPYNQIDLGAYDKSAVEANAQLANRNIAKLMARNNDDLFPNSLLAEVLNTEKDKLFEIDDVQKAGRWSIELTGVKLKLKSVSEAMAYQGCINDWNWLTGDQRHTEILNPVISGTLNGVHIYLFSGFGAEGGSVCSVAYSVADPNLVDLIVVPGDINNQLPKVDQLAVNLHLSRLEPSPDLSTAIWKLLPPSTKLSTLRSNTSAAAVKVSTQEMTPSPTKPVKKTRSFSLLRNSDSNGEVVQKLANSSLKQCQSDCSNNEDCKSFTFNHWNAFCVLKSASTKTWLEPSVISGFSEQGSLEGSRSNPIMQRYRKKAFPGISFKTVRSTSEDLCLQQCLGSNQCIAYVYKTSTHQCRLLNEAAEYHSDPQYDSGVKRQPN